MRHGTTGCHQEQLINNFVFFFSVMLIYPSLLLTQLQLLHTFVYKFKYYLLYLFLCNLRHIKKGCVFAYVYQGVPASKSVGSGFDYVEVMYNVLALILFVSTHTDF